VLFFQIFVHRYARRLSGLLFPDKFAMNATQFEPMLSLTRIRLMVPFPFLWGSRHLLCLTILSRFTRLISLLTCIRRIGVFQAASFEEDGYTHLDCRMAGYNLLQDNPDAVLTSFHSSHLLYRTRARYGSSDLVDGFYRGLGNSHANSGTFLRSMLVFGTATSNTESMPSGGLFVTACLSHESWFQVL
jgi:hypothetical protein